MPRKKGRCCRRSVSKVFVTSRLILPNGKSYSGNPIIKPTPVTLGSYETIQKRMFSEIPFTASLGDYFYIGKVVTGEHGRKGKLSIIDEHYFGFEVGYE